MDLEKYFEYLFYIQKRQKWRRKDLEELPWWEFKFEIKLLNDDIEAEKKAQEESDGKTSMTQRQMEKQNNFNNSQKRISNNFKPPSMPNHVSPSSNFKNFKI